MSDRLREAVRSAIGEMVADAPEPPPYERIMSTGRPAMRPAWPVWALTAFGLVLVVVGAAVWLRPGGTQPAGTATTTGGGAPTVALPTVFVLPAQVPDGLELVNVDRGPRDDYTLLSFTGVNGGDRELLVTAGTPRRSDSVPTVDQARQRLEAAFPDATITERTVRGQPAFQLDVPESDGWTTAVVTVEASGIISEVEGHNIDPGEVLAVADGLTTVSRDDFEQYTADAIDWDLWVYATTTEPEQFVTSVEGVAGVQSVVASTLHLTHPALAWAIQTSQTDQIATTTSTTTSQDTLPDLGTPVTVTVTLDPGTDPEAAAEAIHELPATYTQIRYSSAVAATISQQYLDAVLPNATVIHQDPIVYQPEVGPTPAFDTSNLGTEVPFRAAADKNLDATLQQLAKDPFATGGAPWEGPILYVGSLDDNSQLLLIFVSDRDYVDVITSGSGYGSGSGTLGAYYYGPLGASSTGGGWHVSVRVPLETSIVVLKLDDGTTLWQRPVAGHGLFRIAGYGNEPPPGTITALDTTGATIGQWPFSY
jgi:hypothetical protein